MKLLYELGKVIMSTERIKKLVANMVLNHNYWGFLFSRVRIVEREKLMFPMHVECDKHGTISLVFISNIFDIITEKEILKLLEHEGYHLLNQHLVRLLRLICDETNLQRKAIKIKAWNYASDFVVNQVANLFYVTVNGQRYNLLRPESYGLPRNKIAEWYYEQLMKGDFDEQSKQTSKRQSKNKSLQRNQSGNNQQNQGKKGNGSSSQSKGNEGTTKIEHIEDVTNHSHWVDQLQTEDVTLVQKVRRNIQDIVRQSYKSFKKTRGTLPASIEELIHELLLPAKLPYYQIIRKLVRGSRLNKYIHSSEVINRKLVYTYHLPDTLPTICPFPGYKVDYSFVICIVIDVSGSMKAEDIREALTGIKDIIENDRSCKTIVLEIDTIIQKEYVCNKTSDIQFKVKGRGGTTLGPALFRAKELRCDICLVFTDGYCEDMSTYRRKDLPKKVVWILTKTGNDRAIKSSGVIVRLPN
ncbi:MAG: hypothetical protein DRQ78_08505 [Epsilonproteobacteria bacterium]|nr:MAG: hypothetical protein DRQ78_08505 [Campylobacterota bacterium]